ncbi:conserved hypothetical protein [Culex quinquefasciatus]|uniref:Uncharacterized protein n=1 Tax=Culex quinquefasciatus TaxID=7176 RepID=B0XKU4_CULQU|nr:conserved hypothetical protein [Culex quinquefasciatus]|eukprot:XP_001870266.1 conserved hypothetical protein [Culex quinquefasciatus]
MPDDLEFDELNDWEECTKIWWFLHRSSAKLSVVETRLDAYLFGGRFPSITNQPTFTIPVNFPPAFNMVAAVALQPAAGSGGSAKSSGVESAPLSSTAAAGSESRSAAAQKLQNYQQDQKKMQHHRGRLNRSGEYEAYAIVPLISGLNLNVSFPMPDCNWGMRTRFGRMQHSSSRRSFGSLARFRSRLTSSTSDPVDRQGRSSADVVVALLLRNIIVEVIIEPGLPTGWLTSFSENLWVAIDPKTNNHNLLPQSNAYLEKHLLLLIRVSTTANSVAIFVATTLVVVVEPAFSVAGMSTGDLANATFNDIEAKLKLKLDRVEPDLVQRFRLSLRNQQPDETAEEFVQAVKLQADFCGFGAFRDVAIQDRILAGLRDDRLKEMLLKEEGLTRTDLANHLVGEHPPPFERA